MSVIKCSNCENEILDTEIVCPYCDCPISETIKKLKSEDMEIPSASFADSPADKVDPIYDEDEPKIATSADFEKEKAAILKELIYETPLKDDDSAMQIANTYDFNMDKTVKINRDAANISDEIVNKADKTDEKINPNKKTNLKTAITEFFKNLETKHIVLGITVVGIIVIVSLVWGLVDDIAGVYSKKGKPNKTVHVIDSSAASDAYVGYELHSSTLTITDDAVMVDYDSPDETPWFKDRNKIKHVTFGKNVTRIGAHSFEGFENITDINISDSVIEIGESAFCNCKSLTKITNMSKNIEEIDDYAFTGCKKLSKIPGYTEEADFEPTIERIGMEAFKSCKFLEEFKVPMYTSIDTDAFYGHGDKFVLVCEPSSDAYKYAIEKGIPTKVSFDSELANMEPEKKDEEKEEKPSNSQTTTPDNGTTSQTTQTTPEVSEDSQSLTGLMQQLANATTQAEKDRILAEIDKITQ